MNIFLMLGTCLIGIGLFEMLTKPPDSNEIEKGTKKSVSPSIAPAPINTPEAKIKKLEERLAVIKDSPETLDEVKLIQSQLEEIRKGQ